MDLEDPMMEVVQTHIIPSEETIDVDVVQVRTKPIQIKRRIILGGKDKSHMKHNATNLPTTQLSHHTTLLHAMDLTIVEVDNNIQYKYFNSQFLWPVVSCFF